jgi:SAM-dependent methyltransferase
MHEASKTNLIRDESFAQTYLQGKVLDIGAGGDLICPWAQSFDIEDGDANHLDKYFETQTFEVVHSSHSLEHMNDPVAALNRWWSLVKPNGYLIVVVPEENLYEQGLWPSVFSREHQSSFRLGGDTSWSPVSHEIRGLCQSLTSAFVVSAKVQSNEYDHELIFPKGLIPKKIKQPLKTFISIVRRIPIIGEQLKDKILRSLVRYGYPYDQTQKAALAQIEIIVKKVVN